MASKFDFKHMSPRRKAQFVTIINMVEHVQAMAEEVKAEILVTRYD